MIKRQQKEQAGLPDQFSLPLGGMMYEAFCEGLLDDLPIATSIEGEKIRDALLEVWSNKAETGFLHSMLCSMSLPVREPEDPSAAILKKNGDTSIVIQPLVSQDFVDGELTTVCWGIPYGRFARIILYYVMTEAVYKRSREIELGTSFSDWCRRMGIDNVKSGGKRGTRTLIAEQMRRIMSCQWTFRTDKAIVVAEKGTARGKGKVSRSEGVGALSAFAVQEMKVANRYSGLRSPNGEFVTHFVLTQEFYDHLIKHSVPLNDRAMAALQSSATQMDLYCWLSARLPRIEKGKIIKISWDSFLSQVGNDIQSKTKARQLIRRAWDVVSGAYPEARNSVDFGSKVITLLHADRPTDGRMAIVKKELEVAAESPKLPIPGLEAEDFYATVKFPKTGGVHYHAPFEKIALEKGKGNCLIKLAERFRLLIKDDIETMRGPHLIRRWEKFCESVNPPS